MAVGNPLGELGGTVTDGIISALDREVTVENQTMNLLQTNALSAPAIPAAACQQRGELIGIVNAKSSGRMPKGWASRSLSTRPFRWPRSLSTTDMLPAARPWASRC
ncbi:MAG: hypothetical protein ACLR7U_05865 [Ruthenibacterium lactatiformans]